MSRSGPRQHTVSPDADDERGYGPNPRSQPFREGHAHRSGSGAAWPPTQAAARFFDGSIGGDDDYAYRYYGSNAEPRATNAGHAYGGAPGDEYEALFGDRPEDPRSVQRPRRAGPRGYLRSDARIREDICERLADRADIDVCDVSVVVAEGRVTLEGSVADRQMKHRIDALCDDSPGVREVDNRIRVSRPPEDAPRWY